MSHPPFASPRRFAVLLGALVVAVLASALLSVAVGAVGIPAGEVVAVVVAHLGGDVTHLNPVADQIVWTVRLPRAVLGLLVGAALGVTGAVIQAVVRNPLGDPYLIGIVPGAGVGAVSVIVLGSTAVGGLSVAGAAFVGALTAFAVTFALGRQHGTWPPTRLVLAGVAVGYLCSSVTYFLQTVADPTESQRALFWSLGSVAGAEWSDLPLLLAVTTGGAGWLVLNGRRLNALVSSADLTRSVGIDVGRLQLQLMLLAALMTGAVVAVVGGIGFVGLVVPHVARLLVGADHRRVLPVSMVLGAAFLLLTDIAARMALAPTELPIGIVTAAIGAPFFIWLLAGLGGREARAA